MPASHLWPGSRPSSATSPGSDSRSEFRLERRVVTSSSRRRHCSNPSCSSPPSLLLHRPHHHHHHHVLLLLLLLPVSFAQPFHAPRPGPMQCWEAEIRCLQESECKRAYNQYLRACEAALRSAVGRDDPAGGGAEGGGAGGGFSGSAHCPSHCIHAIIQLNATRGGPGLEGCDCADDNMCLAAKRGIEPCLPRTYTGGGLGGGGEEDDEGGGGGGGATLGCTEARRRCESEATCGSAMDEYLMNCGKLLNGVRCTHACMQVILRMMTIPKALALSECVCDGLERPFCEVVKENMQRLCFDRERGSGDAANYDDADDVGDDDDDDDDDVDDDVDDDDDGYGDDAAVYGVGRSARRRGTGHAARGHSKTRHLPGDQLHAKAGQRRPLASLGLTAAVGLTAVAVVELWLSR